MSKIEQGDLNKIWFQLNYFWNEYKRVVVREISNYTNVQKLQPSTVLTLFIGYSRKQKKYQDSTLHCEPLKCLANKLHNEVLLTFYYSISKILHKAVSSQLILTLHMGSYYRKHKIHTRIKKIHKAGWELVVGRQCGITLGLIVVCFYFYQSLGYGCFGLRQFGACSSLSSHGSLGLNGANMYELVYLNVSNIVFKVVLV